MEEFFESLEKFARFMERLEVVAEIPFVEAAKAASFVIENHVRKAFGDNTKLEPLHPWTRRERSDLGFTENDPLLRDGSLLLASVERFHHHLEGGVGSNEPIMLDSELGYINDLTGNPVPPRPVFEIGLQDAKADIELILEAGVEAAMGGSKVSSILKRVTP